jgi:hypothetical protein
MATLYAQAKSYSCSATVEPVGDVGLTLAGYTRHIQYTALRSARHRIKAADLFRPFHRDDPH